MAAPVGDDRAWLDDATARSLYLDAVTVETLALFSAAGVRAILLKGPTLAGWLYFDGSSRPYGDIDLLVPSDGLVSVEAKLRQAGFKPGQRGWRDLSQSWERGSDGGVIDLHTGIFGVDLSPEDAWRILAARTGHCRVAGRDVETLDRAAMALHVALHAAQHGSEGGKPLRDLDRAVTFGDRDLWRAARELADQLVATEAMAAGLRLSESGAALADSLRLPSGMGSVAVSLHAHGAPPLVLGLEQFASTPGAAARVRFVTRKLVPSRRYLRAHSALARRGATGLAVAYLSRPVWLLVRLPGAFANWARRRRGDKQTRASR